jgi:hypothetical protein
MSYPRKLEVLTTGAMLLNPDGSVWTGGPWYGHSEPPLPGFPEMPIANLPGMTHKVSLDRRLGERERRQEDRRKLIDFTSATPARRRAESERRVLFLSGRRDYERTSCGIDRQDADAEAYKASR